MLTLQNLAIRPSFSRQHLLNQRHLLLTGRIQSIGQLSYCQSARHDLRGKKVSILACRIQQRNAHRRESAWKLQEQPNTLWSDLRPMPRDRTNPWHCYQGHEPEAREVTGPRGKPTTSILLIGHSIKITPSNNALPTNQCASWNSPQIRFFMLQMDINTETHTGQHTENKRLWRAQP